MMLLISFKTEHVIETVTDPKLMPKFGRKITVPGINGEKDQVCIIPNKAELSKTRSGIELLRKHLRGKCHSFSNSGDILHFCFEGESTLNKKSLGNTTEFRISPEEFSSSSIGEQCNSFSRYHLKTYYSCDRGAKKNEIDVSSFVIKDECNVFVYVASPHVCRYTPFSKLFRTVKCINKDLYDKVDPYND